MGALAGAVSCGSSEGSGRGLTLRSLTPGAAQGIVTAQRTQGVVFWRAPHISQCPSATPGALGAVRAHPGLWASSASALEAQLLLPLYRPSWKWWLLKSCVSVLCHCLRCVPSPSALFLLVWMAVFWI